MDLRVLRYFMAVAREESISGAAEYLHLSQPTLSRQLMDLEEEIGKSLFIRGSRRITLTEQGALLRKRASEILDLVEKTTNELTAAEDAVARATPCGSLPRLPNSSRKPIPKSNFICSVVMRWMWGNDWTRGCWILES